MDRESDIFKIPQSEKKQFRAMHIKCVLKSKNLLLTM